jgi:hypothetical protein
MYFLVIQITELEKKGLKNSIWIIFLLYWQQGWYVGLWNIAQNVAKTHFLDKINA